MAISLMFYFQASRPISGPERNPKRPRNKAPTTKTWGKNGTGSDPVLCPTLGSKSNRGDKNNSQITIRRLGLRNGDLDLGGRKTSFPGLAQNESTRVPALYMVKGNELGPSAIRPRTRIVSGVEVTKRAHKNPEPEARNRSPFRRPKKTLSLP